MQFDASVKLLKKVNGSACVSGLDIKKSERCPFATEADLPKSNPTKPKTGKGIIHVDLHNNPVARYPYETDPHKHYSSRTSTDFKTYKPAKIRSANKMYKTTATAQHEFIASMSIPRATTAPSTPNLAARQSRYSFLNSGKDVSRYQYLDGTLPRRRPTTQNGSH